MEIIFRKFDLGFFASLIDQNLMANNSIKVRFTEKTVKSIALTSSRSFVKLWEINTENLICPNTESVEEINDDGTIGVHVPKFECFDMFVLKGDVFKRFLNVFNQNPVDLLVDVDENESIANRIVITGETKFDTPIKCSYTLSSAEAMGEGPSDYSVVEKFFTVKDSVKSFMILKDEMDQVKNLIQTLHKTNSENTSYVTVNVDVERSIIRVFDKVFDIKFPLVKTEDQISNLPDKSFDFRILKSDFIVAGKHTYNLYFDQSDDDKIVMKALFPKKNLQILCGFKDIKVNDQNNTSSNSDDIDSVFQDDTELQALEDSYFEDN